MKKRLLFAAAGLLTILSSRCAGAAPPPPAEMAAVRGWVAAQFEGMGQPSGPLGAGLFFSFTYAGKPSAESLKTWQLKRTSRELDANRTEHTLAYTDPQTGLMVRCVGIEYRDFPTVEWTLYFKNTGVKDTPILENIQALDIRVERKAGPSSDATEFHLHHQRGSPNTPQDYEPFDTVLGPEMQRRIAAAGGHPTRTDLPYFNLELPGGEGLIVVVSWAGQWAATFQRDKENHLQIRAGQELTHFKLLPGEEVRSPLIVLQFWKGDRIGSQNTWRKWMLAHNVPRPGGKPLAPMISAGNGIQYPGIITNAAEELHFLRRYLEEGIKPDYWWQDAGWYPCDPVGWPKTGTWEVEPKRWPKGIRQVSDWCRSQGMKTIVWFEPERVYSGTWLAENHPEWIHGGKGGGLLKLGDPQCRAWLVTISTNFWWNKGLNSTARTSTSILSPTGAPPTPRTVKGSPRSATWKATSPTGTSCAGVIRTCLSTRAPAAAGETTWKRFAARCRSGGAITFSSRWATRDTPTALPSGCRSTARDS